MRFFSVIYWSVALIFHHAGQADAEECCIPWGDQHGKYIKQGTPEKNRQEAEKSDQHVQSSAITEKEPDLLALLFRDPVRSQYENSGAFQRHEKAGRNQQ